MDENTFSSCVGSKAEDEDNRILTTENDSMDVQCLDEEDPIGIVEDNENYLTSNEAGDKNLLDSVVQILQESDEALAPAAAEQSRSKDNPVATTNSMEIVTRVSLAEVLNLSLNNASFDKADKQIKVIKIPEKNSINYICHQCCKAKKCLYQVDISSEEVAFICSDICLISFKNLNNLQKSDSFLESRTNKITLNKPVLERSEPTLKFTRKCADCSQQIKSNDAEVLSWETMEFCKVYCLSKYQNKITSNCSNCKKPITTNKAGQYCVIYDTRLFCCTACLNVYKKSQACSNCQKNISDAHGFIATISNKDQIENFCSQTCMNKNIKINLPHNALLPVNAVVNIQQCSVCFKNEKIKFYFDEQNKNCKHAFCSDPCFVAFKFVHQINPPQCSMCKNFFNNDNLTQFTIFYDNLVQYFCCKTCQNVYIKTTRKIMPCDNCTVEKFNFDMIKKSITNDLVLMFCSLNCLNCYQVATNAASFKKLKCKFCNKVSEARYYLTMSDGTVQNFCTNNCLVSSRNQLYKLPNTVGPTEKSVLFPMKVIQVPEIANANNAKQIRSNAVMQNTSQSAPIPVKALPQLNQIGSNAVTQSNSFQIISPKPSPSPKLKHQIIIQEPPLPPMKNAATMCKPIMHTKSTSCCRGSNSKETQTDMEEKINYVPLPVPIYVPAPLPMFSAPVLVPIPFPVPIPIPIFIPLNRNSADRILDNLKTNQMTLPKDSLDAEILEMAKLITENFENTDSEKDENGDDTADVGLDTYDDDVLQVVDDVEELLGDIEDKTNNIITEVSLDNSSVDATENQQSIPTGNFKRREHQHTYSNSAKRRRGSTNVEIPISPPTQQSVLKEEPEATNAVATVYPLTKATDKNLKYKHCVNIWEDWVADKNKSGPEKLIKTDLLQLTEIELSYYLCLFINEIKKINGSDYKPDTVYYICLGIQKYLNLNGKIYNIFTDKYFEKFTDYIDEKAKKFFELYKNSDFICTPIEEEHLWESNQLGVHSPIVLLNTLMYFNTKYFRLSTVNEHMQLSFNQIKEHYRISKKDINVLLKLYPKNTELTNPTFTKFVQYENIENPLRCPVKLYEFYLTKCPKEFKIRENLFYLQPEASWVPDSPLWYSSTALDQKTMEKMLNRLKFTTEINIALLSS